MKTPVGFKVFYRIAPYYSILETRRQVEFPRKLSVVSNITINFFRNVFFAAAATAATPAAAHQAATGSAAETAAAPATTAAASTDTHQRCSGRGRCSSQH